MGPADQKVWEKLLDKVPTPVKDYIGILKERFLTAKKSTQYAIGSAGVLVLALLLTVFGGDANVESSITFEARRGGLEITVLEGGSLEALQSQEIRSRIKGREGVKILNIVEEGYQVTPEDVDAGLVLVELDKAALIDQQLNQEIAVETAEATYIESSAEYEIQLNENMTALTCYLQLSYKRYLVQ